MEQKIETRFMELRAEENKYQFLSKMWDSSEPDAVIYPSPSNSNCLI